MKRKGWLVAAGGTAAALLLIRILMITTSGRLAEGAQTAVITSGPLESVWRTTGTATGQRHVQLYQGAAVSVAHQPPDEVARDEVILRYQDAEGSQRELKAECAGFLSDLQAGRVELTDRQMVVETLVPAAVYHALAPGAAALWQSQGARLDLTLSGKNGWGQIRGEETVYRLIWQPADASALLQNQQGVVTMTLADPETALLCPRAALHQRQGQWVVYSADWLADLEHPEAYAVPVSLVKASGDNAAVSGVGLEGLEVVILDGSLGKLVGE